MKNISKVARVLASVSMLGAATVPAFAEGTTYTPVTGGSSVVLEKYLVMDENANVPNVSFAYTIAPGAAQNASATGGKVFAGNDASAVVGTPTIAGVTFAAGDTTYTSAQDLPASVNTQKMDNGTTVNKDKVTLASGQKYARKDIVVNFGGVTFKEPGVYRYIITETASDTTLGITDDSDNTRVMDVYVVDNAGSLQVQGYVLHNNANDAVVPTDGTIPTGKAAGFQNEYTTHDLVISKTVTGNQGSRDEYFKFTVTISGAIEGTVYNVDLSNADATTKINGINTETHSNPTTLTANASGTVTQDFWLQNGQSIMIKGLANNTAYSIAEDDTVLDNEGYTTTCAQTGDTDGTFTAGSRSLVNAAITADTTDAFTNDKTGTIPTGVFVSVAGPMAVVGIAGAGAYLFARKKKEDEE